MEKNTEVVSLTDALRKGISPEDIRKSFEAALQDAQNEVTAEQTKASRFCGGRECKGDCSKCADCTQGELDEAREDLVHAVIDYLFTLGVLPEDLDLDEEDIEQVLESIKEVEKQYRTEIGSMKMLAAMVKMDKEQHTKEKVGNKEVTDKPAAATADDIIAKFLKGLR